MRSTSHRSVKRDSLLQRSDLFRKIVDHMQIGVIVADAKGYIVYINDTYARFLELDPNAQIGRHATEVVSNTRLHIVAKTGIPEINYPHQFKDIGYLVQRIPIKEDEAVIAVLGLVLFENASTANRLAEKLTRLETKLALYEKQLASLRATRYTFDHIIGRSRALKSAKKEAMHAATNDLPVLITGESGTGKELFAQAIHHASSRKSYPFIRVNCAAIPKDLFESELFGYEKGAYTGANAKGKPGKFELAHLGTIFLDEIGDLPVEMQPKLLRVLESREFERVGGNRLIRSDFRMIAATNQDLGKLMEARQFRKDLFYRINVIPIKISPLRERRGDILPLVTHFLGQSQGAPSFSEIRMDKAVATCLKGYSWPGNGRELLNVIERTLSSLDGGIITVADLPLYLHGGLKTPVSASGSSLREKLFEAEREVIRQALKQAGHNKSRAARTLGIHRTLLYRKMKLLGLMS